MEFSGESIIKSYHILADLENIVCIIDSLMENKTEELHGILSLDSELDRMNLQYVNQFLDYTISKFRLFMENAKFFPKKPFCNCIKCETIGYPNMSSCVHDIILTTRQLIMDQLIIKQKIMECQQYDYSDELFSDQIYISKFITFTKYFISEFINCCIDESIFPLIPCEKKCCK